MLSDHEVDGHQPNTTNRRVSVGYGYSSSNSVNQVVNRGSPLYSGSLVPAGEISFADETLMVVRLTLDKQFWAVGLSKGDIKFLIVNNDKSVIVNTLSAERETMSCTDFQFVPYKDYFPSEKKHLLVATYASGQVRLWHYTGATPKSRLLTTIEEAWMPRPDQEPGGVVHQTNQTLACSCSLDGQRFVTGGEDTVIRVYDIGLRQEVNRCCSANTADKMDGHTMRICSLMYHPRGAQFEDYAHFFVSGGWDNSLQIWDDRYGHSLWQYFGPHISGTDAVDIDPQTNHIVTSSWRRENFILQVWRFKEEAVQDFLNDRSTVNGGRPVRQKGDHPIAELQQDIISLPTMGYVARWMGSQYVIYAGSNENMLKVVDRGSFNTIGAVTDLPSGVYSVATYVPDADTRKPYKIAFCVGSKLLIVRMDKK